MKQRRERILEETRRYLTEEGYDGLTMRGLAERAGVAATTVFNIFGTKESLVAEAVHDRFDALSLGVTPARTLTIDDLVAHEEWMASTVLQNASYARAMVILYFSESVQNQVVDLLRNASTQAFKVYFAQARERQVLADWVDSDVVARMISNQLFSVVHDWAIGEIADDNLADHMKLAFALILSSVLVGDERKHVDTLLRDVAGRVSS